MTALIQGSTSTFKRLFSYLKPYRAGFVVAVLGMIGYASVDVFFLSQFDQFIDRGITDRDMGYLSAAPFFVVLLF
ncbi:MAG: hypothetical protein ACK4NN_10645, partial [Rheinheimera sp.]